MQAHEALPSVNEGLRPRELTLFHMKVGPTEGCLKDSAHRISFCPWETEACQESCRKPGRARKGPAAGRWVSPAGPGSLTVREEAREMTSSPRPLAAAHRGFNRRHGGTVPWYAGHGSHGAGVCVSTFSMQLSLCGI